MYLLVFFINYDQLLSLPLILLPRTYRNRLTYINRMNFLCYFILLFLLGNFLNHQYPLIQNQNINYFLFFK